MALDKLFIMKQSIIIYKYKQDLFVRNPRVFLARIRQVLYFMGPLHREGSLWIVRSSELGHAVTMEL